MHYECHFLYIFISLQLELSEEKSISKIARRNEEKLKQDVELLEKRLKK